MALAEFIQGFLRGAQEALVPPSKPARVRQRMARPTRAFMKSYISKAKNRTHARPVAVVRNKEYHVIYAYIRSAVYTVAYERAPKKKPKLVGFYNGKPNYRELCGYIQAEVKEQKKRADRAAATWGIKQGRNR